MDSLLFFHRPTHPRIRRVKDWIEVEEALALLALEPSV